MRSPPFRAPHHSASTAALIGGGGASTRPGEVSLAHGGVLFLDELGEFNVAVLEALRQPLEEGRIRVSRLAGPRIMPARFQLVAATNPCPCGYARTAGSCRCVRPRSPATCAGSRDHFWIASIFASRSNLLTLTCCSVEVRRRPPPRSHIGWPAVRRLAADRGFSCNADIPPDRIDEFAPLTASGRTRLLESLDRGDLTGRGVHRVRLRGPHAVGPQRRTPPNSMPSCSMRRLAVRVLPSSMVSEHAS